MHGVHNTCDPKTGGCKLLPANEGKSCDDGEVCTIGDVCADGGCDPGTGVCCTANADCLKADDGDLCNGTWFCNQAVGQCFLNPATVVTCPTVANSPCKTNLCAPKTGLCGMIASVDGGPCDDGNPCTSDDACKQGACQAGKNSCPCNSDDECVSKDDGDLCNGVPFCDLATKTCKIAPATVIGCPSVDNTVCHKNVCVPKLGKCSVIYAANGVTCEDGVPCTLGDVCAAGQCKPGADLCACKTDAACAGQDDGDLCNGVP